MQPNQPPHSHQSNNIKITYTPTPTHLNPSSPLTQKQLSIMTRLSTDGGVWITNGAWRDLGFWEIFQQQVRIVGRLKMERKNEKGMVEIGEERQEQEKEDVGMDNFKEKRIVSYWGIRKTLGLISNRDRELPSQLSTIDFPHLLFLCLDYNNIQSIQPLSQSFMPCLTILHLNDNKITSLKPLSRAFYPQLRALEAYNNNLIEYFHEPRISEGHWPKLTHLSFIKLNSGMQEITRYRYSGLGELGKLETKGLEVLGVQNSISVYSMLRNIYACVCRKYKDLKIINATFAYKSVLQAKYNEDKQKQQEQQQKNQEESRNSNSGSDNENKNENQGKENEGKEKIEDN